jgi:hypothetical protein
MGLKLLFPVSHKKEEKEAICMHRKYRKQMFSHHCKMPNDESWSLRLLPESEDQVSSL